MKYFFPTMIIAIMLLLWNCESPMLKKTAYNEAVVTKDALVTPSAESDSVVQPPDCDSTIRDIGSLDQLKSANKLCVKIINVTFNDVVFPKEILECLNLEVLHLGQCFKLKEIPPEIGRLKKLKYISIFHSPIDSLPSSLLGMDSLQTLNVAFGHLKEMPPFFCDLKNLQEANLRGNRIKEVPDCVFSMPKFKFLIIQNMDEPIEGKQLDIINKQAQDRPKGFYFEY